MDNIRYQPLQDEDSSSFGGLASKDLPAGSRRKGYTSTLRIVFASGWMTAINACLLVVYITLLIVFWLRSGSSLRVDANRVLQQSSFYSPMFDRYQIAFEEKVVKGSLFNEETLLSSDIVLRSYPSSEVDAAWDALTHVGIVTITSEEVRRLGKDPKQTVKSPPGWHFGTDAYLAQVDGQHALHCLNAVRRYAYREHYFPSFDPSDRKSANTSSLFNQAHLSHCLHILLQTLTCNPSMDLITHNWVDTQEYPFPDFAINKKCINHKQLLDWQSANELSDEEWMDMARRGPAAGETVMPMSTQFQKWAQGQSAD